MVECDLAKVEVAGSNPVSRSNIFRGASPLGLPGTLARGHPLRCPLLSRGSLAALARGRSGAAAWHLPSLIVPVSVWYDDGSSCRNWHVRRRRRQEVRQRSAKPPSPVQIRAAPPIPTLRNEGTCALRLIHGSCRLSVHNSPTRPTIALQLGLTLSPNRLPRCPGGNHADIINDSPLVGAVGIDNPNPNSPVPVGVKQKLGAVRRPRRVVA